MTMRRFVWVLGALWPFLLFFFVMHGGLLAETSLPSCRSEASAKKATAHWRLPQTGPPALDNQSVVFIAEDLRNGGVLGVGVGVREAAAAMGWKVHFLDIGGRDERRQQIFKRARELSPDGVILGGVDAQKNLLYIEQLHSASIPMIGWHSAADFKAGQRWVRWDVATDPGLVAQAAASYVVEHAQGKAGGVHPMFMANCLRDTPADGSTGDGAPLNSGEPLKRC